MAISPNGTGLSVLARKRYVVTPEVVVFDLTIGEEQVTLNGYAKGPGCPVPILIGVAGAWATWEEDRPTREETGYHDAAGAMVPGLLSPFRWNAKNDKAEMGLRRDLLRETVPGLTLDQANILASDGGPAVDMLQVMRWMDSEPQQASDDDDDEADTGEAVGEAGSMTGPAVSPAGSPATATTPSPPGSPSVTSSPSKNASRPKKRAG